MTRQETRSNILNQFDKSAKDFCDKTGGLFCEISSKYVGKEEIQNVKYHFAKIYYNSFTVKFIYATHLVMNTVNSVLSCTVSFDKNDEATEVFLPLLTDYCDKNIYDPMCIPFITNEEGMEQSFNCIGGVLIELLDDFLDISCNAERRWHILAAYEKEINYALDININDMKSVFENTDELILSTLLLRFSSAPFMNLIKGRNEKVVKQLKKVKRPTGYEKRLVNLCSSSGYETNDDLSAVAVNVELYNDIGVQKANFKEFIAFFVSWIILTIPFSIIYLGLFFALVYFQGRDSICILGPIYNFPAAIGFGFFSAIAASYFTRFKFYKWFYKEDYERYKEMDYITNGIRSDKFMKIFFDVIFIICIVGCVLLSKWNLNFKENGFTDNSDFFSFSGEFYSYSEIDHVYYKEDRVNDFGDTLDFPSYVIVLDSGREIDLYEHADIEDYEKELMDFLKSKDVKFD